jgi:hypothetical protein
VGSFLGCGNCGFGPEGIGPCATDFDASRRAYNWKTDKS